MAGTNWKRMRARSLRHAMELCVTHAKEVHHRSVERIAEMMGEESHWTLYKWMENGRMPASKITAFEHACGIDFVTQYQASSAGYLLVKVPTGKKATHKELNELSQFTHATLGELLAFYDSHEGGDSVKQAINQLIEDLSFQRGNIEKFMQPELL